MFPRRRDHVILNQVSASLPDDSGKIDVLLFLSLINQNHVNQVAVEVRLQRMGTDRTIKIDLLSLAEIKIGMLYAGIISDFWMKHQQSFVLIPVSNRKNNMVTNFQMALAVRAYKIVYHGT